MEISNSTSHIINIYEQVLTGKLKRFPRNFLNRDVCETILRYVVLDQLKFTRDDICKYVDISFMRTCYIGNFNIYFNKSHIHMVKEVFREYNIMSWELSRTESGFWQNRSHQRLFMFWLIQKEGLDVTNPSSLKRITYPLILKYTSHDIIDATGNMFNLIRTVTGDIYKEWEVTNVKKWSQALAIDAVKWLIEDKLNYDIDNSLFSKVKSNDVKKYGLESMLINYCNNSIITAIHLAYPELIHQ